MVLEALGLFYIFFSTQPKPWLVLFKLSDLFSCCVGFLCVCCFDTAPQKGCVACAPDTPQVFNRLSQSPNRNTLIFFPHHSVICLLQALRTLFRLLCKTQQATMVMRNVFSFEFAVMMSATCSINLKVPPPWLPQFYPDPAIQDSVSMLCQEVFFLKLVQQLGNITEQVSFSNITSWLSCGLLISILCCLFILISLHMIDKNEETEQGKIMK